MINTEICLFIKRSEIELENVHRKLRLLLTMVEADAVEDCLDTTHGILDDVRDATKDAAARIGSSGTNLSLKLYDIGKAQKAAAPETAKAAAEAVTITSACGNCKSDGAGHYIGTNCACTNASELKGGELNG